MRLAAAWPRSARSHRACQQAAATARVCACCARQPSRIEVCEESPFEAWAKLFLLLHPPASACVVGKSRKSGQKTNGAFFIVRSSGAATSPVLGMRGKGNTPAGDSLDYHSCKVRSG